MKIYITPDFKCHVDNDGTMREFEVEEFDGKCKAYIEGFYYVPPGEARVAENGVMFRGEQHTPWKDYAQLVAAQAAYEEGQAEGGTAALLAEAQAAYEEGVNSI